MQVGRQSMYVCGGLGVGVGGGISTLEHVSAALQTASGFCSCCAAKSIELGSRL